MSVSENPLDRLPMADYTQSLKTLLGFTEEEIDLLRGTEEGRLYIMCIGFSAVQLDSVGTVLVEAGKRLADLEKRVIALERNNKIL